MEKIYIFGHKNPDTDSVTSAISLSYLKNKMGYHTIPCILGEVNNETKFVLNYFKVNKPLYLNDTKLQVSDLKYGKWNRSAYDYDEKTSDLILKDKIVAGFNVAKRVSNIVNPNSIKCNRIYV